MRPTKQCDSNDLQQSKSAILPSLWSPIPPYTLFPNTPYMIYFKHSVCEKGTYVEPLAKRVLQSAFEVRTHYNIQEHKWSHTLLYNIYSQNWLLSNHMLTCRMTKVVQLGSAGWVGSHLAEHLLLRPIVPDHLLHHPLLLPCLRLLLLLLLV